MTSKVFLVFLILSFFNSFKSFSQVDCECCREIFLNDSDTSGTNLRETPNGRIIATVKNRPIEELFVIMEIVEVKDNWFKVNQTYPETSSGWIYAPLTGVHTTNYDENEYNLYEKPDNNSSVVVSFKEVKIVNLLTCENGWFKVKLKLNDNEFKIGWIESEKLCGSPYTYCN